MRNKLLEKLEEMEKALKALRGKIKKEKTKTIGKKELKDRARFLAEKWFREVEKNLQTISKTCEIQNEIVDTYHELFLDLLRISAPNNLKTRYESILKSLCSPFRKNLILPIQSCVIDKGSSFNLLDKMFADIKDSKEKEYIEEAVGCAKNGFLRGAAVLGWCAAIDRIHRKIEKIGFSQFNMAQAWMASQQQGRFKKFKRVKNVTSLNELRTQLFDTEILWIIEGMGLIDSNQHTRLKSCYNIRCQSAHPGDAPVKEPNLISFFSDINEIIFKNPKFQL